jgi:hypothetical protein
MNPRLILTMIAAAALAIAPVGAQNLQRRAVMTSGGSPEFGRCTAEVIVDGAAEVEIRGDMASLRDLSGRPPEWRRFECTGPMPANAANVRFTGEGRGSQRMIRTPNDNNGTAVVRIQDSEPGANLYRFELSWNSPGPYPAAGVPPMNRRFGTDQAVQACQDTIRRQAMDRFGARQIVFRRINMDDNPGRNDWVVGMLEIRRPDGMEEHRRFSCSVNFENGRIRSADIEAPEGRMGGGSADRDMTAREMEACRQAIGDRMRSDGYSRIDFGDMNIANRYGNDWITGTARVQGGYHPESFDFSCSVSPGSNYVRSTDVHRR